MKKDKAILNVAEEFQIYLINQKLKLINGNNKNNKNQIWSLRILIINKNNNKFKKNKFMRKKKK